MSRDRRDVSKAAGVASGATLPADSRVDFHCNLVELLSVYNASQLPTATFAVQDVVTALNPVSRGPTMLVPRGFLHRSERIALLVMFVCSASSVPLAAQPSTVAFPPDYIAAHKGKNAYVVSPGLELANILVAVAFKDADIKYHPLRRKSAYYQEVLEHFSPFASHVVFDAVHLDPERLSTYTTLRNSSYRWYLCGDEWCHDEFLGSWWRGDKWDVFTENAEQIAEFARDSGFQAFYEAHQPYYDELAQLYASRVDLDEMIRWLSVHFEGHYDAYTILFSPLILGNQSTTRKVSDDFRQVFMIVDPPAQVEDMTRALNSFKWVFTELDHQFVNPESDRHAQRIDAIFADRKVWTDEKQSTGYKTALSVFNEYMTWAVYLAYVDDHFEPSVVQAHSAAVVEFMEGTRGFILFGEFVEALRSLQRATGLPLAQLYPDFLRWAETRTQLVAAGTSGSAPMHDLLFTRQQSGQDDLFVLHSIDARIERITNHRAKDSHGVVSPDGGRIVFNSDRRGWWKIWVMKADGSDVRQLTDPTSGADYYPAWSPDGARVVFASGRNGNGDLFTMAADGSDLVDLVAHPARDNFPAWSPDGSSIAFASDRSGHWAIHLVDQDGSNSRQVTYAGDAIEPDWFPDGRRIVFQCNAGDEDGRFHLWTLDLESGLAHRLTQSEHDERRPSVSPDGKWIAFESDRAGGSQIFVLPATGGAVRQLTAEGYCYGPRWVALDR